MLQIGTGKLFDAPHRRENHLIGRIFTAIDFDFSEKIHTCAGNIQIVRSTDNEQLSELEFEFYEKMEDETGEGVLISRCVETYAFEFSAHLSFAVGCFFSPDENSVQRLSSDSRTFLVPNPANHYTGSFFKKTKLSTITNATEIASYFASAHGLQRKTYLAVTRSIETYINGLQRTADSLETAYSLIVSALESTAALHSAHKKSTWEEYDQGKARKIDHALNGADITTANAVREAILEIEHKTILRGVVEFAKSHVTKNFFTDETVKNNPIQNEDLESIIRNAYQIRSSYLHESKEIPRILAHSAISGDFCIIEGRPTPTLSGLARLTRHIILNFIERQPKLEKEPHDYMLEQDRVLLLSPAPQYWIGRVETLKVVKSGERLKGFLDQVSNTLWTSEEQPLTDLRPFASEVIKQQRNIKNSDLKHYLVMFTIFNGLVSAELNIKDMEDFLTNHKDKLDPDDILLLPLSLLKNTVSWSTVEYKKILQKYYKQRNMKDGIRFHNKLELALTLRLAEDFRNAGDIDSFRETIDHAIRNSPGRATLIALESNHNISTPLAIGDLLRD